ncbi:hypothetical protein [Reyranella sp.]|uniref:hypothetical protein n=1 Tax=Reyranella sp. TaxID=1929291 RepID=UPI003C7AD245
MDIEEEFVLYVERKVPPGNTKARDVNLICYYFGFGDSAWPTLELTASKFSVGTRERVRQILNSKFRNQASIDEMPILRRCRDLLASRAIWSTVEYVEVMAAKNFVTGSVNVKGLLRLMQELGSCGEYDLYNERFYKPTREEIEDTTFSFIAAPAEAELMRKALQAARSRPGLLGLANSKDLADLVSATDLPILKSALQLDANLWKEADGREFWYCLEDRENTLFGYAEKAFALSSEIEISRLAECLANALKSRASKYVYPDVALVRRYLCSSKYFECNEQKARFLESPGELTGIQTAVVDYFKKRASSSFAELRDYLVAEGFGLPIVTKAISNSPIVFKNASAGRGNFKYSLITSPQERRRTTIDERNRYEIYRARLRKLDEVGTDAPVQAKRRREQYILQEWLFGNKSAEKCAICGEQFSVSALVVAHKKKRSECNPTERLDPHVVMPLCLFGCDYLYERRLLCVMAGKVRLGTKGTATGGEMITARRLDGRPLESRWLQGASNYFD